MSSIEDVMGFLGSCGDIINAEREISIKSNERKDPHNSSTSALQDKCIHNLAVVDCKLEFYIAAFALTSILLLCKNGLSLLKRKKKVNDIRRRRRTLAELFSLGNKYNPNVEGASNNIEEEIQSALLSFQEVIEVDLSQKESEDESDNDVCVLTITCDESSELPPLLKSLEAYAASVEEVRIQFHYTSHEPFEVLRPYEDIHSLPQDNSNTQLSIEDVVYLSSDDDSDLKILSTDQADT